MQTPTCFIPLLFILHSCVHSTNTSFELTANSLATNNNSETKQELVDFVESVKGTWVNKEFYESIVNDKSPYKSQEENPYYLVYIKPEMIENNAIGIYDYSYGQTEISSVLYYELSDNKLAYRHAKFDGEISTEKQNTYFKKMNVVIENGDTILHVERNDHTSIDFVRINNECLDDDFDCEISQFITSTLLAGNYILKNQHNEVASSNFKIDKFGRITGNNSFKRAMLWNFFREVNHMFECDVLELTPSTSNKKPVGFYDGDVENLFKFECKTDTIVLKQLLHDTENDLVTVGSIAYYLIRK